MQYLSVKSVLHRTLLYVATAYPIAHDTALSAVFPSQVHSTDYCISEYMYAPLLWH
jgi:hypothetical protein